MTCLYSVRQCEGVGDSDRVLWEEQSASCIQLLHTVPVSTLDQHGLNMSIPLSVLAPLAACSDALLLSGLSLPPRQFVKVGLSVFSSVKRLGRMLLGEDRAPPLRGNQEASAS
jgi:hypothetical protein